MLLGTPSTPYPSGGAIRVTSIPMHSPLKFRYIAALCVAAMLVPLTQAQLLLSGNISGEFTDTPGPNDTIYNAPDGSSAWFRSGIPENTGDKQTSVEFAQQTFTDIGPGLVATDIFTVTNGRTLLLSTATEAHFDLHLQLTAPESHNLLLTSIPFTIVNTPNGPGSVDDVYSITSSPIAPFKVSDYLVQFEFSAPENFSIDENQSLAVGELRVSFTPVPEPSTYAAVGATFLLGIVGYRTMRRRQGATAS